MKKFLTLFFVFTIYFNLSNQAYAGAAESWTIEEVVYNDIGKNLSYTASKTGAAANDYIYKAKVPVTAAATGSTVAAMIRMGLAGAAIYGIVEGVGWIIENGVVKKKVKEEYNSEAYFFVPDFTAHFPTPEQAVKAFLTSQCSVDHPQYCSTSSVVCPVVSGGSGTIFCNFYLPNGQSGRLNVDYRNVANPPTSTYEPVPDSDLGNEVNKSPEAPSLLPDIYNPNNPAGGAAPKATSDALNNANPEPRTEPKSDTIKKPNKDTNGDGQPDVYDPALPDAGESTVWPEACQWFPTICEWYKKYKEDSDLVKEHRLIQNQVWSKEELARQEEKQHRQDEKTFWQKVEEWFDWTKEPPEPPEKVNIPTTDLDEKSFLLNVITVNGAYCPENKVIDWDTPVGHFSKTVSYQNFCDATEWFGYLVLAASYYLGALIVVRDS